jgi:hypothetical protein
VKILFLVNYELKYTFLVFFDARNGLLKCPIIIIASNNISKNEFMRMNELLSESVRLLDVKETCVVKTIAIIPSPHH